MLYVSALQTRLPFDPLVFMLIHLLCPFNLITSNYWVSQKTHFQNVVGALVVESMQAHKPGLQAPSNLAGSKIKNTNFFPY